MRTRTALTALLAGLIWMVSSAGARADSVLLDQSGFIVGTQSFVKSFYISQPGTLVVTLSNVDWPAPLASLSMLVTSTGGALSPELGLGVGAGTARAAASASATGDTERFQVGPGMVYTQWYGSAQGALDAGVYGMKVDFIPAGQTVVPLPRSIALLLSGLALLPLLGRGRRQLSPVPDAQAPAMLVRPSGG
jgi:hypothetical protein